MDARDCNWVRATVFPLIQRAIVLFRASHLHCEPPAFVFAALPNQIPINNNTLSSPSEGVRFPPVLLLFWSEKRAGAGTHVGSVRSSLRPIKILSVRPGRKLGRFL